MTQALQAAPAPLAALAGRLRPLAAAPRAAGRLARIALTALRTARELRRLGDGDPCAPAGSGAAVLSRASAEALRIHGLRVEARGPLPSGPALLVCNHVSYLDPVVLMSLLPCLPAAKREVAGWPVFGPLARAGGVHFVDRRSRDDGLRLVHALAATLRAGVSALNFAEGTTSDGSEVLPFRPGGFAAAALAGAPIVPVALRYRPAHLAWTGDATFAPHYLRFAALEGGTAQVHFGTPLPARPDVRAAAAHCRAAVQELLEGIP